MNTHVTPDTEVLSTNECWALLRDSVVGRLAVTVVGSPDIFPVNPIVDHGSIVFRTSAGTKLAATKGKEVAFEVDGYDTETARAWSVVVKGQANEILEVEEILRALRLPLYWLRLIHDKQILGARHLSDMARLPEHAGRWCV